MLSIVQSTHDGVVALGVQCVNQLKRKTTGELLDIQHALEEQITTGSPAERPARQIVASAIACELQLRKR